MPRKKSTNPVKELKDRESVVCCWAWPLSKIHYESAVYHHFMCPIHLHLKEKELKEKENEST